MSQAADARASNANIAAQTAQKPRGGGGGGGAGWGRSGGGGWGGGGHKPSPNTIRYAWSCARRRITCPARIEYLLGGRCMYIYIYKYIYIYIYLFIYFIRPEAFFFSFPEEPVPTPTPACLLCAVCVRISPPCVYFAAWLMLAHILHNTSLIHPVGNPNLSPTNPRQKVCVAFRILRHTA